MTDKAFTTGTDVNDFTVVCDLHNLYLKPICKVHITVQISGLSCIGSQGRCLSTWEVSEKLRQLCPSLLSPPTQLKVTGATVEFVRFVVELDSKADVKRVIKAADSQRIKLSGFPQALRVRAGEAPIDCPRKHDWDAFFRDARDMDELLPGERPDTVVVSKLPVRWFAKPGSSSKLWPDPKVVEEVFQIFGKIRCIDIPMLDPCQNPQLLPKLGLSVGIANAYLAEFNRTFMEEQDSVITYNNNGFGKITPSSVKPLVLGEDSQTTNDSSSLSFTAYIQYAEYAGFAAAMEALRGKKLVHIPPGKKCTESPCFSAEITIDFDRSKHLSDYEVRRRQAARARLEVGAEEEREKRKAMEARRARAEREAQELAAAQLAAERAEEEARRLARREKRRLKAEERYLRKRDALMRRKFLLENRRALLATRRATAIRLMSALLHLVSKRFQEENKWAAKCAEDQELVRTNSIATQTTGKFFSEKNKSPLERKPRQAFGDDGPMREVDAEKMRQSLLEKREQQLRQKLLSRRISASGCKPG
uniref:A-kinase anchor protein 17A n=2 Tax=Mesocestoides corti TaxID=53468 RepID=A0A5K3F0R4_MESCO